jgi:tryptophan synthase alpha chain
MNRINKAFENKKALIAFITGGDPDIETTEKLILAIEEAGADMIKIGIPFSDPVAEGPVIQEADKRALESGCTTDKLFDMVKRIRAGINIPVLFMTYANPVYSYGKDKFAEKCKECGIDGIIVPDVPFEEKDEFESECKRHDICLISLIAPTSAERTEKIAREAAGFLYCVSLPGAQGDINGLIKQVRQTSTVPCVSDLDSLDPEQVRAMAEISDGVISGSAIVEIIAEYGRESIEPVKKFIKELKNNICVKY